MISDIHEFDKYSSSLFCVARVQVSVGTGSSSVGPPARSRGASPIPSSAGTAAVAAAAAAQGSAVNSLNATIAIIPGIALDALQQHALSSRESIQSLNALVSRAAQFSLRPAQSEIHARAAMNPLNDADIFGGAINATSNNNCVPSAAAGGGKPTPDQINRAKREQVHFVLLFQSSAAAAAAAAGNNNTGQSGSTSSYFHNSAVSLEGHSSSSPIPPPTADAVTFGAESTAVGVDVVPVVPPRVFVASAPVSAFGTKNPLSGAARLIEDILAQFGHKDSTSSATGGRSNPVNAPSNHIKIALQQKFATSATLHFVGSSDEQRSIAFEEILAGPSHSIISTLNLRSAATSLLLQLSLHHSRCLCQRMEAAAASAAANLAAVQARANMKSGNSSAGLPEPAAGTRRDRTIYDVDVQQQALMSTAMSKKNKLNKATTQKRSAQTMRAEKLAPGKIRIGGGGAGYDSSDDDSWSSN